MPFLEKPRPSHWVFPTRGEPYRDFDDDPPRPASRVSTRRISQDVPHDKQGIIHPTPPETNHS